MSIRATGIAFLVACSSLFAFGDAVTLNTNANTLAAAVMSGNPGVTIVSATLSGQSNGSGASTGTFTNIYGLGTGAVFSTGNAADYGSGPNTSPAKSTEYGTNATLGQEILLNSLSSGITLHDDVTELDITFTVNPGVSTVSFNMVFGSEEYPDYVGSGFSDAFGLFLNGTNIALADGEAMNVDNPCFVSLAGTELNGILGCGTDAVTMLSGAVQSGTNTLSLIIADSGDDKIDSTVYFGTVGTTRVLIPRPVPEPSTLLLLGTGALTAVGVIRRRMKA